MTFLPIRILVTDDDPLGLSAATRILTSAGYEVLSAANGEETLRMVEEHHPDLILLDVVLPDIEGTEICRRLKADVRTADIYIILLSGVRTGSDEQSQGLEGGADGYIARPIANRELLARIQAYIRIKNAEQRSKEYSQRLEGLLREHKQMEEELRSVINKLEKVNLKLHESVAREELLARTDGLTGLYNYRYFFELAAKEFHVSIRYKRPLSFIMFDADNFKKINDTFGHSAGDKLLAAVAEVAATQVRASDVLARYGGDEFVIMLPHTSALHAFPVAERIRASVAAMSLDAQELASIALSIGIAEMRHVPMDRNVESIIQRADMALYTAKQNGRNRTVIFDMDEMEATP